MKKHQARYTKKQKVEIARFIKPLVRKKVKRDQIIDQLNSAGYKTAAGLEFDSNRLNALMQNSWFKTSRIPKRTKPQNEVQPSFNLKDNKSMNEVNNRLITEAKKQKQKMKEVEAQTSQIRLDSQAVNAWVFAEIFSDAMGMFNNMYFTESDKFAFESGVRAAIKAMNK